MDLPDPRQTRQMDRTETTRVACPDCGVVQQVEVRRDAPDGVNINPPGQWTPWTDEECSVCETALTIDDPIF